MVGRDRMRYDRVGIDRLRYVELQSSISYLVNFPYDPYAESRSQDVAA